MMEHQQACEDVNYSTPANLRQTVNSAMFGEMLSPPCMFTGNNNGSRPDLLEPQLEYQRRSFVVRMDQQLREQREEVEYQQAEHADQIVPFGSMLGVPNEDDLEDSQERRTTTTLPLRPYYRHPDTPLQTCSACARLSMETPPPNGGVKALQCQQCRGYTPSSAADESSLRPMQVIVDLGACASTPQDRFVLQGPGYEMDSDMDESLDGEMQLLQQPRRIQLRPKMRSESTSPILSISSSTSMIEETDFVTTFVDVNNNITVSSTPVVIERTAPSISSSSMAARPLFTAPLLPLMSPENSRPSISRAPLQIRVPPASFYATPGGLSTPR